MSTKATNRTPHYGLSQWESGDHILRTDFNADFAAIDAALHALKTAQESAAAALEEKAVWRKLGEAALSADGESLTLDLSGIDLGAYNRLDLQLADITPVRFGNFTLQMQVNEDTAEGSYACSGGSSVELTADNATDIGYVGASSHTNIAVELQTVCGKLMTHAEQMALSEDCTSYSAYGYNCTAAWKNGALAEVQSLRFFCTGNSGSSGGLKAGAKVTVYGRRK